MTTSQALTVLICCAMMCSAVHPPPQKMVRFALPLYLVGVVLLLCV